MGFLSLGSNLGDRLENLKSAVECLKLRGITVISESKIYETPARETTSSQGVYLNMALKISTELEPSVLLEVCLEIEKSLGRKRPFHHAPRTIDIDILMLGDLKTDTLHLVIPHPGLEQRDFVIYPLCDIAPEMILPSGMPIIEIKNKLINDEIKVYDDGF